MVKNPILEKEKTIYTYIMENRKKTRKKKRRKDKEMGIIGLQKMTLLDYPEKVACTVFLSGCQFHCPWCHNAEITSKQLASRMEEEEFFSFLKTRRGFLDGVCFTGGEPLLYPGLEGLIRESKKLGFLVKVDTNGYETNRLRDLVSSGLVDYLAMDIKNSPALYGKTVGIPDLDIRPISASISYLLQAGVDYEFRTTLIDQYHSLSSMAEISHWIHGAKRYFLQPFEDRETVPERNLSAPSPEKIEKMMALFQGKVGQIGLRGRS